MSAPDLFTVCLAVRAAINADDQAGFEAAAIQMLEITDTEHAAKFDVLQRLAELERLLVEHDRPQYVRDVAAVRVWVQGERAWHASQN
jgi:hypothetical protein